MKASNNLAVPEIRLRDVISSKAVVIANPGTNGIIAANIVNKILVTIKELKVSRVELTYLDLRAISVIQYTKNPIMVATKLENQLLSRIMLKEPAATANAAA